MPFLPYFYGYPSSSPRAHCTPNKSVPTLRYTRRHGPVGTCRVQSPGFPKIVCCSVGATSTKTCPKLFAEEALRFGEHARSAGTDGESLALRSGLALRRVNFIIMPNVGESGHVTLKLYCLAVAGVLSLKHTADAMLIFRI